MSGTQGYRAAVLVLIALLAGCATPSSMPDSTAPAPPPANPGAVAAGASESPSPDGSSDPEDAAAVPPADLGATLDTWDPWHRFNRGVYRFNARFDEAIHLPIAAGYRRVVPREVRSGIGNFFGNLGEIGNTANHLLQARPGRGLRTAGRFLINSTLGIAGLFDVADRFGLSPHPTSFGDTLGRWGVGQGPYLVLPILGPSTLRDGLGAGVDLGIDRAVNVADLYSGDSALLLGTVLAIDARSQIPFRYYESGSPFEYELVRFLYTRKRAIETGAMRAPAPTEAGPRTGTETDPRFGCPWQEVVCREPSAPGGAMP